ncbi:MAG TPA: tRNA (N6-isopentenyl adenosine(37)-C2)-methylthiotransferase MiaB [Spirochaetota bacterium]|nr:tRNA (N6-isopentenyl adenosine(37)-C2)-methylthiotransferase MiaB [Spirochaetota bacterium]HPQ54491.1 tRNA (N6-isopentenyl adenosine(37)-C2)-methylthiotransferase MiaB [Spirochaetota bacterium]
MKTHTSYYIETFGCQMNKNDSDLMGLSMNRNGFHRAENPGSADILIFNTCSVRNHAENRAIARMKSSRGLPGGRNKLVVCTGCMAQRIGNDLIQNGTADIVAGPYQSPKIGEIVAARLAHHGTRIFISQDINNFSGRIDERLPFERDPGNWHEWVTITHGCENFCSYCIVPHVRGKLISFPSEKILSYIRDLTAQGVTEITLLGQNVNQYGMDCGEIPFYRLLEKTASIEGLNRVNFLTSHPKDFSNDIVRVIKDNPAISRAIHLPLQSGSDRILKLMNRGYTIDDYRRITDTIASEIEHFSLSTDLIVGFPGETDEEYRETLRAVETLQFDEAYTYAYSPRSGTAAFDLGEGITPDEKRDRLAQLIELQRNISRGKLERRIDCTEEMIIETISKKSSREVMGKTFLNHPVVLPGLPEDIGKKIRVRIKGLKGATLYGERTA